VSASIGHQWCDYCGEELVSTRLIFRVDHTKCFESRRLDMIAENQWPKDKPLPDPEQYLAREVLDSTLKAMNYVPTKIEPAKK